MYSLINKGSSYESEYNRLWFTDFYCQCQLGCSSFSTFKFKLSKYFMKIFNRIIILCEIYDHIMKHIAGNVTRRVALDRICTNLGHEKFKAPASNCNRINKL